MKDASRGPGAVIGAGGMGAGIARTLALAGDAVRFHDVHPETGAQARDLVGAAAHRCGKNPMVVSDQPLAWHFVANRINAAVRRQARRVVAEGVARRRRSTPSCATAFAGPWARSR